MDLLRIFDKMSRVPGGKTAFTRLVCLQAPYFSSIRPTLQVAEHGRVVATMSKRRAVLNHIKTVHIIAVCNLCELSAGLAIEVSLPNHLRWIPKGMTTHYLKKCETDLSATCCTPEFVIGDNIVHVAVTDTRGETVLTADINMYVTERKPS